MPVVDGRKPVKVAAREGLHAGETQYARVNNIPRLARRSRFGVLIGEFGSSREIQSFMSSTAMKSTSFRCSANVVRSGKVVRPIDKIRSNCFMVYLMLERINLLFQLA